MKSIAISSVKHEKRFMVGVTLLRVICAMVITSRVGSAGLIAHYQMDGSGVDAAGSADGILVGTPTFESGLLGSAIRTESGSYMAVPNGASFKPGSSSFTVALNFNLSGFFDRPTLPDFTWAPLLSMQAGDFTDGAILRVESGDVFGDSLQVVLHDGSSFQQLNIDTGNSLFDGWHHAAYTVDRANSMISLYLDGQNIGSSGLTVGSLDPTFDMLIGQYDFGFARNEHPRFLGGEDLLLDEVMIFDSALNDSEIHSLASAAAVPEPGTFALLGIGTIGIIGFRSRKQKQSV